MLDEEVTVQEYSVEDFMKPRCPVKVGDRIYRKHKTMTIPDRLEVIEIAPHDAGYFIKCKYLYHAIGQLERMFSDAIFKDDAWVIERKGVDF